MDAKQAQAIMEEHVREMFGRVLELRNPRVARRAAGRAWVGDLVCVLSDGDVRIGRLEVADDGRVVQCPGVDDLVRALRGTSGPLEEPAGDGFADDMDFSDLAGDEPAEVVPAEPLLAPRAAVAAGDEAAEGFFGRGPRPDLRARVNLLIAAGGRENLEDARVLLPQLLADPAGRGETLVQMAEVEIALGERDLGLDYLEAAAREFADLADVDSLARVAERALEVQGAERFSQGTIKALLDRSRARLKPVPSLKVVPIFVGLSVEEMFEIEGLAQEIVIRREETILEEGKPAVWAFVVKSGILSVRLDTGGSQRVVRCCYPGDFVGETSVLGAPGATCTATVRAECVTSAWRFEGNQLREICRMSPDIKARIESAGTLHRLDSFLSTNETTGLLDTRVRDRLLACLTGIRRVPAGETLSPAGERPRAVFLVAEGRVEHRVPGAAPRVYEADSFAGLRDTLHDLPLEGDLVAVENGRLVTFDADGLRALAAESPPEVVAVLERLE